MKRVISFLLLVPMLIGMLVGCSSGVPRPEIRKGKFNISVTYEHDGELKTLSGVYVCKYTGAEWTVEGNCHRSWKGYFESGIEMVGEEAPSM